MDDDVLKLSLSLKEELINDSRIVDLSTAEKAMENDDKAKILSYKKEIAVSQYNDMIRIFGRESKEAQKSQRKLYEIKKELDSLPSVINYLAKYRAVRMLDQEINEMIFNDFRFDICKDHHK